MDRHSEWPDDDVRDEALGDLPEQEAHNLYETAVEMYRQVSKGNSPQGLLDDFEEFLAVVKNTREQER